MTRRTLTFATPTQRYCPAGGQPLEPQAQAWCALCERVYQAGLRLVPVSEGGLPILWDVDGDQWSTTVTVEPVELRPASYLMPKVEGADWAAEGTTGTVVEARVRGPHTSAVVADCHCEGCDGLREFYEQRREREAHVLRPVAKCRCAGCIALRQRRNDKRRARRG